MKNLLFVFALLVVSPLFAEEQKVTTQVSAPAPVTFIKRIHRGDMEIGGATSMGYSSNSGVLLFLSASLRYFVIDKFSLGGILSLNRSDVYTAYGLGPSAAYYFFETERWAAYLQQDIVFNQSTFHRAYAGRGSNGEVIFGNQVDNRLNGLTAAGFKYFMTPSVALDFKLLRSYLLSTNRNAGSTGADTRTQIGLSISI